MHLRKPCKNTQLRGFLLQNIAISMVSRIESCKHKQIAGPKCKTLAKENKK